MNRIATVTLTACFLAFSAAAQQCPPASASNWCSGVYQYDGAGNIKAIGADTYSYDALSRLTSGTADVQRTGVPSRQTYTYDPFGNRTAVGRDAGSVNCVGGCEIPITVSSGTNHITSNSAHYDEAGNLDFIQVTAGSTTYPATYMYDSAGSLAHANSTDDREFIYTADDERIAAKNGVTWTWTIRGLTNKVLREYTSMEVNSLPTANLQWVKDYVFRDGQLLASVAPSTPGSGTILTQHYHLDHLGTPRVVTNAAGAILGIHAYYAFGAELDLTPKEPSTEQMKFTGHERDLLPGGPLSLDNMHARYDMASLGRFLSMDPGATHPDMPQSWNRYVYAGNNPITNVDADGREWRQFAKEAGIERLIDMLAARAPGLRDTLARYDGPQNPDLRFKIADLSKNVDGDDAGTFNMKMSEGDVTYDTAHMNQSGDPQEFLPFTGKFLTAVENYHGGVIELSNKLDLRVLPKIDKETARVVFHEIGHADLASRNTLLYLKLTANDQDSSIKNHDDRPVEKQANQYAATRCHESKLCPDQ